MHFDIHLFTLFVLALPISSIAWTVTHEGFLREPREWCARRSTAGRTIAERKFFCLFTCEYCFTHYVTIAFLALTGLHLLYDDWRGVLVAGFALVWIANISTSGFGRLRLEIKQERVEIASAQAKLDEVAAPVATRT